MQGATTDDEPTWDEIPERVKLLNSLHLKCVDVI